MKQITIVTPDRAGLIADISEALDAAGVNIESIAAEQIGRTATIVMTVDRYDAALKALSRTPFKAVTEDAILLKLEDRPGALAAIARRFRDAGISLHSIQTISREGGTSIVAISAKRSAEVLELVKDVLIS